MRFTNVILGLSMVGLAAAGALAGCGSDTGGGSTSTGSTGTGSTSGGLPCSPTDPVCNVVKSDCIALADNSAAKTFTLRMADLNLTKPVALTKGLVKGVVQNGVQMNLSKCNLNGGGTFSWLLQFDTAAGTLKTGGAKPTDDPTKGYAFVDETVMGLKIAPITLAAPIKGGMFSASMGLDVVVPIYLDTMAMGVVLLPLKKATLGGTVSADNNCIGTYNAKGLDPAGGCVADDKNPAFIDGGTLDGYITLEAADSVVVDKIGQTLCVILSGDAATYGDGGSPIAKCKRDAMQKITFVGDWCDATNDATCKDSVKLGASYAASAVKAN